MYTFYKIIAKTSKFFSNVALGVFIPLSFIIFIFSLLFVIAEQFLTAINLWEIVEGLFANANGGVVGGVPWQAFKICQLVFLIIIILIALIWIIFITFLIVKKILFKNIGGMLIARNKEYRNLDINIYQEKLEKYRYRD